MMTVGELLTQIRSDFPTSFNAWLTECGIGTIPLENYADTFVNGDKNQRQCGILLDWPDGSVLEDDGNDKSCYVAIEVRLKNSECALAEQYFSALDAFFNKNFYGLNCWIDAMTIITTGDYKDGKVWGNTILCRLKVTLGKHMDMDK